MSVLDPYAKMNNDPSFTPGSPVTLLRVARTPKTPVRALTATSSWSTTPRHH